MVTENNFRIHQRSFTTVLVFVLSETIDFEQLTTKCKNFLQKYITKTIMLMISN